MIRINNWQDLSLIEDDPELWREAYGFLSVCAYEVREYGDDEEDFDINLAILEPDEWDYAKALGLPGRESPDASRMLWQCPSVPPPDLPPQRALSPV